MEPIPESLFALARDEGIWSVRVGVGDKVGYGRGFYGTMMIVYISDDRAFF
jgi:hypothetical protein